MSLISQTREWVNQKRAEIGLRALDRLPRGIKGNEEQCVIARALVADMKPEPNTELFVQVDGNMAIVKRRYLDRVISDDPYWGNEYEEEDLLVTDLPSFAVDFIKEFDEGRIEKLVEV